MSKIKKELVEKCIIDAIKKGNKSKTEKEIIMLMGKSSSKKIPQKKEVK